MANDFIPLHNRSAYSFGAALTRPEELAEFAAAHGLEAIALTDRDGLYAAVRFQQACARVGVRPILGAEFCVALGSPSPTAARAAVPRTRSRRHAPGESLRLSNGEGIPQREGTRRDSRSSDLSNGEGIPQREGTRRDSRSSDSRSSELRGAEAPPPLAVTLLAQDLAGYGNLCRLISRHHLTDEGLRVDDLAAHAQGLICLAGRERPDPAAGRTAGPPHAAPDAAGREGLAMLNRLREAFAGRLYVELDVPTAADAAVARRRARMADELGLPVVATGASRCLRREDGPVLKALASIGTLTLLDQPHPDKPVGDWHLRTPAEMRRQFARRPDALRNTLVIAEQCHVELDLSRRRFPGFASPDGRSAAEHLRDLAVAGCRRRYVEQPPLRGIGGKRPTLAEALERLDRELRIIEEVHYAEYFLVFHEIAEYCRREGISFLARGSAADSLVCYALGVSHACPFRFDLPFDRFLNPERVKFSKLADIDLDLPWDRRDQVINWVYERWGHDRVAMIGAPHTFQARAAVAELGKVFGLPPREVHRASRLLSRGAAGDPAADAAAQEEPYATILRLAAALEGLPRHWAMHPCGLVVAPAPLTDLVPVQRSPKGPLVAQYDADAVEELGLVKIDLLGQAGLSVLRDAVAEIHASTGVAVDLERDVDYADPATWDLIASGQARGVHHIESPAMTSLLRQCQCRDIDCLTAIVAIIRPGAANQGKKETFVRRHRRREPPRYAHPSLRPVLEKTYGLMVFEEHILQVATEFAGMNLGRADVLRRALNKRNQALVAELAGEFRAGALARGRRPSEIDAVWAEVEGFSGFMFNKAHSAEYAVEAFQGAWLKRRWPAHYLAAVLSNYRGFYAHSPTLPQILYVMEARQLGFPLLPPCVNASRERFSVTGDPPAIRVPVAHIAGLSASFLARYRAARSAGPFESLEDWVTRCRPTAAEAQALLDSGALDGWGASRPALFWRLRRLLRDRDAAAAHLFSERRAGGTRSPRADEAPPPPDASPPVEWSEPDVWQKARRELDLLGFPISLHPLTLLGRDEQGRDIDWSRYTPLRELERRPAGRVRVCGLMVAERVNATRGGELMEFVTLADHGGVGEGVLFPAAYRRFGHLTASHPILEAVGMVEAGASGDGWTLRVEQVSPPARREPKPDEKL